MTWLIGFSSACPIDPRLTTPPAARANVHLLNFIRSSCDDVLFRFILRPRDKNSLPLTPKTVHLLRLPRTIGKRKRDDNKFFPIFHKCLPTPWNSHFQYSPVNGL